MCVATKWAKQDIGARLGLPEEKVMVVPADAATIAQEKHDIYLIDYRLGEEDGLELLARFDLVQRPEPFIIQAKIGFPARIAVS